MKPNYYQDKENGASGGSTTTSKSTESISELKKRIAEIEGAYQVQSQALEQAADAIISFDQSHNISFFNKAAEVLFGFTRKEIIGKNSKTIIPSELNGSSQHETSSGQDIQLTRKDKSTFWADLTLTKSESNGRVQYTVFIKDISERRRLEEDTQRGMEQIKASEEELRQNMEEMTATQEEMARKQLETEAQMSAINSSSAYIEFTPDGNVILANDLFLQTLKYSLKEIENKHHRIFCESSYSNTRAYEQFWNDLRSGKAQAGEFKRIAKDGSEVWLLANYTPVFDKNGKVTKVIKLANNITEQKLKNIDYEGQLDAIGRSNAVVEFDMDGNVLFANDNFIKTLGYSSLNEIKGKHHRTFVSPEYARSNEYRNFWDTLNRGEFFVGTYTRINKRGEEVFIQASYNPIKDADGKPYKVVKYALDMTEVIKAIKAMSKGDLSMRCDTTVDNGGLTAEINKTL
ncbi:MAG TPA: PAS domain S-box protein, partial [Cyclobacteriaceae bacterium]|nr:PAS domain S-box protein [Cyclobacteriaceae bacterium]